MNTFLSIAELGARYRDRTLSPVEATAQALARIAALDGQLNSFIAVLESESLAAADAAERELAKGIDQGRSMACPSRSRTWSPWRACRRPLRRAPAARPGRGRRAGAAAEGGRRDPDR